MADLIRSITRAIEQSGQTRYRIAKGSGVSEAQLSRLVNHRQASMTVANVEVLVPMNTRKGK